MGVERAVTRWYAQRQLILKEIDALQARLAQPEKPADTVEKHKEAQARLRALGPCPKALMG